MVYHMTLFNLGVFLLYILTVFLAQQVEEFAFIFSLLLSDEFIHLPWFTLFLININSLSILAGCSVFPCAHTVGTEQTLGP